jgi:hypothetical protein
MVSTLSNLLATAIVLGGLLLRFTVVPSGLVSEEFLEAVGTVAFMAGLGLLVFIALAAMFERRSAHQRIFTSHDWLYVGAAVAALAIFTGVMTGWISGLFGAVRWVFAWAIDPKTGALPSIGALRASHLVGRSDSLWDTTVCAHRLRNDGGGRGSRGGDVAGPQCVFRQALAGVRHADGIADRRCMC